VAGLVDRFDTAEQRQAAIAASEKPSCLVIDFAGNSGRHKLITTADILGGKTHDEEVIERAKEEATKEGEPVRMDQLLDGIAELMAREAEERRKREAARRAHLIARAQYTTKTVNPFDVFQLKPANERGWDRGRNLSEKQRNLLLRQGIDPKDMPYAQAKQLIDELFRRWDSGLATMKQCALLRRHGYDTKNVTMKQASELIDALAANHWRRPAHEMDQG
jgi:hypothetical protein